MKIKQEKGIYILQSETEEINGFKYLIYCYNSLYPGKLNFNLVNNIFNKINYDIKYMQLTFNDLLDIISISNILIEYFDDNVFSKQIIILRNFIYEITEVKRYLNIKKIKNNINARRMETS